MRVLVLLPHDARTRTQRTTHICAHSVAPSSISTQETFEGVVNGEEMDGGREVKRRASGRVRAKEGKGAETKDRKMRRANSDSSSSGGAHNAQREKGGRRKGGKAREEEGE